MGMAWHAPYHRMHHGIGNSHELFVVGELSAVDVGIGIGGHLVATNIGMLEHARLGNGTNAKKRPPEYPCITEWQHNNLVNRQA